MKKDYEKMTEHDEHNHHSEHEDHAAQNRPAGMEHHHEHAAPAEQAEEAMQSQPEEARGEGHGAETAMSRHEMAMDEAEQPHTHPPVPDTGHAMARHDMANQGMALEHGASAGHM